METARELTFILGPSIGFNREVILTRHPDSQEEGDWCVPAHDTACQLFRWIGMSDPTFQETKDFGQRRASSAPDAPPVHLRCFLLTRHRYEELLRKMHERQMRLFKQLVYRDVVSKTSKHDWHTAGMLLYVFDHLDR